MLVYRARPYSEREVRVGSSRGYLYALNSDQSDSVAESGALIRDNIIHLLSMC